MNRLLPFSRALACVLLVSTLLGCATTRNDPWPGRVGNYTFDQAVTELGPPDKQARLQDGTLVAEWLTRRGQTYTHITGGYLWSPYYYPAHPEIIETSSPDYFLRLAFAPDGALQSWKRFAR